MCGIAGIVALTDRLSPETLRRHAAGMAEAMAYRGPDGQGVWVDPTGRCALAHRRLSIIDLSPDASQPMASPGGDCHITYNGELYNYLPLRAELAGTGVAFHSRSDTEVLLAGLEREGAAFLERIDAMYALGLWDRRDGSLLLARDNFGEKPLYYCRTEDYFAFASELHALAALPGFDDGIERWRLTHYLSLQYLPAPETVYRGARKLPPGHWLRLTRDGGVVIGRHFTFTASDAASSGRPLDDLADELEAVLVDTLRDRLIADVPLGALLSSGVDSSTVVALIARRLGRPLKTFSMGFAGAADSEHVLAAEMAAHLGTEHHQRLVSPDFVALARDIATRLDEPNGDTSCLPTLLLSQHVREHVTVALSGDGGDELFGGYPRYFDVLSDAAEKAGGKPTMVNWRTGKAYYSARILTFPDHDLAAFAGEIPRETAALLARLRDGITDDPRPLGNVLRQSDVENYLPGAVLAKVDRMSMQASLEVRAPLLGRRVAQFAAGLAAEDCFAPGRGKRVLKRLATRYIPAAWIDRPKLGFGLPISNWGVAPMLTAVEGALLAPEARLVEWFGRPLLEAFIERQRQAPRLYQLWSAFILESWLRHHPARPA